MTVTKRDSLIPVAPLLWEGFGGQRIDKEFWLLSPYYTSSAGDLLSAAEVFDLDEECFLRDLLNPLLRPYKMDIQVLDGRFFMARKTAWNVDVCPWIAQQGKKPSPVGGASAEEWQQLSEQIRCALLDSEFNVYRQTMNRIPVEGLWINSGGFDTAIKDISFMRVIQTNSTLVKGICCASGINHKYVTKEGAPWPTDCPEGDRLSILSRFDNPEVKKDPALWTRTWNEIADFVEAQIESSKNLENLDIFTPVLVATDGLRISKISRPLKQNFFPLFKKNKDFTEQWISPKE